MHAYFIKNKRTIIIAGILLFMIITNPSPKDFYAYDGRHARREAQLFIASIYTVGDKKYVGIADNFIKVKSGKELPVDADTIKQVSDTIKNSELPLPPSKKDPLGLEAELRSKIKNKR